MIVFYLNDHPKVYTLSTLTLLWAKCGQGLRKGENNLFFETRWLVKEGPRDQVAFYAFLLFFVEVQSNAGYIVPRLRYSNLEIRIAGPSGRSQ